MKSVFTLFTLGILLCNSVISQEKEEISITNSGLIDQPEYSFWVKG